MVLTTIVIIFYDENVKHFIRIVFFVLLAFTAVALLSPKVHADTATGSYAKMCLAAKALTADEQANLPIKSHNVKLTKSGAPTNKDIFIVGCIVANDTAYCQTGDAATDAAVKKLNFPINPFPGHDFVVFGNNPIRTTDGNILALAHSQTPHGEAHAFYGVFAATVTQTGGQASTLQYGTFDLGMDPGKCASIHWDPSGRVFDAQSLEPLPNTQVSLLDSSHKLVPEVQPDPVTNKCTPADNTKPLKCGEKNPQVTDSDGLFNFDVLDGTYYVQSLKSTYTFPVDLAQVHPNYAKAYWCNESTQAYPIYTKPPTGTSYPIKVAGQAIHCDVPLKSANGIPFHANPQIARDNNNHLLYSHSLIPGTTTVKYEGTVTHPLTKVSLVDTSTAQTVAQVDADRNGDFEMLVDNATLPNGGLQPLKLVLTKVDLTTLAMAPQFQPLAWFMSLFKPHEVQAQTEVSTNGEITFDPIFTYVEGYAYDVNGKVLPNAKIDIMIKNSNDPQYTTTADANGFFTISPDNLPIFSYYFIITPANSSTKIRYTTSQFAKMNSTYLTSHNVNLLTATKNGQSLIPTAVPTVAQSLSPTQAATVLGGGGTNILLTIIILIVLFLIAGAVLIYIKKRSSMTGGI